VTVEGVDGVVGESTAVERIALPLPVLPVLRRRLSSEGVGELR
jgi:hypothetical protein